MRLFILVSGLVVTSSVRALAQTPHTGEAAATYEWVHTNTQPGACGCFGLNGGGVAASWNVSSRFAAVVDVSGGFEGNGPSTGNSLTLVSYTAGGRYYFRPHLPAGRRNLQPFAQLLAGAAHAGGGIAGAGDGTYAFAGRAGGGVDLPINQALSIRVLQVDYYSTSFANATNDHQNNLLLGAGIAVRWSR
ncbi:MAG: hypothetical protein ACRYFU_23930 [Janthinobacterium lividum]